jgi:serine/threonine protein kinase/Tol biopolymer transport system component
LALTPGTRLGVYNITAQVGEGGMGQVYRARDTKLDRDVAIKILPEAFTHDADRLARFQREAKTLASLNHPHIAAIYGLEESGGVTALVMELVEGEDLSQRIARGAIPLDEALPIAKQIAEALEAAHEHGIIHRDLKPANIKVRDDGTVKVLDFGLAKAMEPAAGSSSSMSMSPTLTTPAMMTGVGLILGTAAYMSPEQAKGRAVDKRSDIWAFGAVLFEMLTGRRAFGGDDVQDTFVAIMRDEPDWTALPAAVPATVVTVMRRCLQKDRKQRVRDIGDVSLALEGAFETTVPGAAAPAPAIPPRPFWRRALPVVAAAVIASAIAGAAGWTLKPTPPLIVSRFAFALGEGQQFTVTNNQSVAVSPDGTRLVYVANNQLYLRSMSDLEARPIPGTQQTPSPYVPVFSPDGQSIAFFSQVDRAVKKIAVSGGATVTICPLNDIRVLGMTWDAGGIVFGEAKGIMRVSANGGQPEVLVSVKDGEVMYGPQVLPGGEWLLFTLATAATADGWNKAQIVVQSLKSSERKTLVSGGSDGRYLPTGHLVYALGGVLFAVPFDLTRLAVTGGPVPVVEGVKRSSGLTGTAHFSVSSTGTLVFVPGPASMSLALFDLALVDRNGAVQPLKLPPGAYEYPRLSPDSKRIAFGSDDGKDAIVWIYDVAGARSARRLTLGGRNRVPVWSADGERVAFQSDRDGDLGLFWQRADGTDAAERLTKPDKDTAHVPESWSPDGQTLLFSVAKGSRYAVAALSLTDKKVTPVGGIQSPFPPAAVFSPDGKWMAYTVAEAGAVGGSLFVQPFPATGATYPISKGPGIHPTWAPDGRELFYGAAAGPSMVAVSITARPTFTFGNPVPVPRPFLERGPVFERNYDITLDGKRFLGVVAAGQNTASGAPAAPQIQVVLNWTEELKARVPTK